MTVRTWFTISAVVLVVLAGAVAYRLFAPVPTPAVLARADDVRLEGAHVDSCWPRRGERLRCRRSTETPESVDVPRSGTLRFIVAYPAEPDAWQITVASGRETVAFGTSDEVTYDLAPGSYRIEAQARYPGGAFVAYLFRFSVR